MNKRQAKEEALQNKRTVRELLDLVDDTSTYGMSKLNKSLTRQQVLNIFRNAWAERDPDEVPKGMRYSFRKDRDLMSSDGLCIWNILRECA